MPGDPILVNDTGLSGASVQFNGRLPKARGPTLVCCIPILVNAPGPSLDCCDPVAIGSRASGYMLIRHAG